MKRIFAVALAIIVLAGISACKGSGKGIDADVITIGDKTVKIEKGDNFSVSNWGDEPEYFKNDETLKEAPVLLNDITIGSDIDAVIKAFGIKPGYASVDREIDTSGDGTTDIVTEEYKNTDFFSKEKVLDAAFKFAYKFNGDKWELMPYKELEAIPEEGDKTGNTVIYNIDFLGGQLADESKLKEKQVISFSVRR